MVLFLNLPNKYRVTRRYMCSYHSPLSLLPPYELISLAAIVEGYGDKAELFDAIAHGCSLDHTIKKIEQSSPSLIVTILGFECFEEDIKAIRKLKVAYNIPIAVIGHLPTVFPEETMKSACIDYIITGEPDIKFSEFYSAFRKQERKAPLSDFPYQINGMLPINTQRIKNVNDLPLPAHHLLPYNAYFEPLMPKPMGMIQSARGCPYSCNYCVKSFGTALSTKSPEIIIEEIKAMVKYNKVKYYRFIDDTFTVSTRRVIEICKLIIKNNLQQIKWSCLSRTDNINPEILKWMHAAGCMRIYFGIESGSQRILDLYNKRTSVEQGYEALEATQSADIETTGFFMMGFPEETWEDVERTLRFVEQAALNFAGVEPLVPYPGTPLYNRVKEHVIFSLLPYRCDWKDPSIATQYKQAEKAFYKRFYLRPSYLFKNLTRYAVHPIQTLAMVTNFAAYMVNDRVNIMNGIYYKRQEIQTINE